MLRSYSAAAAERATLSQPRLPCRRLTRNDTACAPRNRLHLLVVASPHFLSQTKQRHLHWGPDWKPFLALLLVVATARDCSKTEQVSDCC